MFPYAVLGCPPPPRGERHWGLGGVSDFGYVGDAIRVLSTGSVLMARAMAHAAVRGSLVEDAIKGALLYSCQTQEWVNFLERIYSI